MKISELVKQLESARSVLGDVDVLLEPVSSADIRMPDVKITKRDKGLLLRRPVVCTDDDDSGDQDVEWVSVSDRWLLLVPTYTPSDT